MANMTREQKREQILERWGTWGLGLHDNWWLIVVGAVVCLLLLKAGIIK